MAEELVPWYRRPILLGLLGLGLMVGGWKLSTWVPPERRLAEVRRLADPDLRDKLDEYVRRVRGAPPYELPGRLVLFAGLILFVVAGVRMYRQKPPEPVDEAGPLTPGPS